MKRALSVCLALALLLCGCGKSGGVIEQSGNGYEGIVAVGDTCYLLENSGIVDTLDMETGKTAFFFRGPEDVRWVADGGMQHLYFCREGDLFQVEIPSGAERLLLAGTAYTFLDGVAGEYLLLKKVVEGTGAQFGINQVEQWSLNVKTLEARQIAAADGQYELAADAMGGEEPLVYLRHYAYGPDREEKYSRIEEMNLETGETRTVVSYDYTGKDRYFFGHVALAGEQIVFIMDEAVYIAAKDGSGARELEISGGAASEWMYIDPTGRLLVDSLEMKIYACDLDAGTAKLIDSAENGGGVRAAAVCGDRFGVLYYSQKTFGLRLLLGDMNE